MPAIIIVHIIYSTSRLLYLFTDSESGPSLSPESLIGIVVALGALFLLALGISTLFCYFRRKFRIQEQRRRYVNELLRHNALLSNHLPQEALLREPPPRYTSQQDLTLAHVNMAYRDDELGRPPPYYSSQADLCSVSSLGTGVEAPPAYTSHVSINTNTADDTETVTSLSDTSAAMATTPTGMSQNFCTSTRTDGKVLSASESDISRHQVTYPKPLKPKHKRIPGDDVTTETKPGKLRPKSLLGLKLLTRTFSKSTPSLSFGGEVSEGRDTRGQGTGMSQEIPNDIESIDSNVMGEENVQLSEHSNSSERQPGDPAPAESVDRDIVHARLTVDRDMTPNAGTGTFDLIRAQSLQDLDDCDRATCYCSNPVVGDLVNDRARTPTLVRGESADSVVLPRRITPPHRLVSQSLPSVLCSIAESAEGETLV